MNLIIRSEIPVDHAAVRELNRLAFGGEDEAWLVDALREGGHVRASFVAELEGRVVGQVLFSELRILTAEGPVEALALAPLAVVPKHQGRGIGSRLTEASLATCREAGHRIVIVLGHPDYYARFGFSTKRAERLRSRYSGPSFMALELIPGALDGVTGDVQYAPPFDRF
jgi:putative acetyltransferase